MYRWFAILFAIVLIAAMVTPTDSPNGAIWGFACLGVFLSFLAISLMRTFWPPKRQDAATGLCPTCGYDLRASKERCPECGTPISR